MRLLLDTCIVFYMIEEEDKLSRDVAAFHTYARLTINEQQGHNDPSDHLIIAHAITERMPLISSDHKFDFYCPQGLQYICNACS